MKKYDFNIFFSSNEFTASVCINNKLYCMERFYNTILSIDLNSAELDCMGGLKDEVFRPLLFTDVKVWKDKIIYIPCYAEHIHIYDIKSKVDTIIHAEQEDDLKCDKRSIAFWNEGKYYLLPFMGEYILEMDLDRQIVRRKMNISQNLKNLGITYNYFSVCEVYQYNNYIYIAMYEHPCIIMLNLNNNIVDILKIPGVQNGFMSILGMENRLYILSREKSIIVYNLYQNCIENIYNLDVKGDIFLSKNMFFDGHIYFWEIEKKDFIDYNIEKNIAVYSDFCLGWNLDIEDDEQFKFLCCIGEKKVILIAKNFKIIIYDLITGKGIIKPLKYDKENIMQKISKEFYGSQYQMSCEQMIWDLAFWLKYCKSKSESKQSREIGSQIWRNLKGKGEIKRCEEHENRLKQ